METKSFVIKASMVKEHPKLYKRLNIGIYCLSIPLLLIVIVFAFLGCVADKIEDFLCAIRIKIITFIFQKIYKKRVIPDQN